MVAGRHDHLITIKFPLLCHYRVIFFSGRSSVSTEHMNNVLASHTVVSSLYLLSYRRDKEIIDSLGFLFITKNDVGLYPAEPMRCNTELSLEKGGGVSIPGV